MYWCNMLALLIIYLVLRLFTFAACESAWYFFILFFFLHLIFNMQCCFWLLKQMGRFFIMFVLPVL